MRLIVNATHMPGPPPTQIAPDPHVILFARAQSIGILDLNLRIAPLRMEPQFKLSLLQLRVQEHFGRLLALADSA